MEDPLTQAQAAEHERENLHLLHGDVRVNSVTKPWMLVWLQKGTKRTWDQNSEDDRQILMLILLRKKRKVKSSKLAVVQLLAAKMLKKDLLPLTSTIK